MKAITTKHLGPTNTKGDRIKAFDTDGNQVTVSTNDIGDFNELDSHVHVAWMLIDKMQWDRTGDIQLHSGGIKDGMVHVMEDIDV